MSPQEGVSASIGKSVEIRGEVKGNEDLLVDGHVEGTITLTASRLTIGPHAAVEANLSARDVIVIGQVKGDVRASGRVELRKGCDLTGDIVASRLTIEENAVFHGRVELSQEAEKPAPAPAPAAAGKPSAETPLFNPPAKK